MRACLRYFPTYLTYQGHHGNMRTGTSQTHRFIWEGQKPHKKKDMRLREQNSRISLVKGERDIRYAFSSSRIHTHVHPRLQAPQPVPGRTNAARWWVRILQHNANMLHCLCYLDIVCDNRNTVKAIQ